MASAAAVRDVQQRVSPAEWGVRVDLAAAYRMVALHGWDDLLLTQLSARVPESPHFLIHPAGLLFEEITASSLVKIDVDGNKVMDSPHDANPAGFVIHGALHQARADVHCVMHLHTVAGQAVAAQRDGLLPLSQTAMHLYGDVAYHDYEGIVTDVTERARLVRDLGSRHVMILRHHGTLVVGERVSDAWMRLYFLERACAVQAAAMTSGAAVSPPPFGTAEKTAAIARLGLVAVGRDLAWPALLRRLDRLDPSFRE